MIAIIDYGMGNLRSVQKGFERVGAQARIVQTADEIRAADKVVLPGVGAFRDAIGHIREMGLEEPILEVVRSGRPFLGICLGLQLLFEGSDEDGAETLGVLRGRSVLLQDAPTLPHIGWNQVERRRDHPLFEGIADGADAYFVHSYVGAPLDADVVVATTEHGSRFVSAVARGRLAGVQFHPERSGDDGLRLLANFRSMVAAARTVAV